MTTEPPQNIIFFGQDVGGSYIEAFGPKKRERGDKVFYSDAATSCIIAFASGSISLSSSSSSSSSSSQGALGSESESSEVDNVEFLTYGHLSTKENLEAFFVHLSETVSQLFDADESQYVPQQHCVVTVHATGAVDSVNKKNGENAGEEMKDHFLSLIEEFNRSNVPDDPEAQTAADAPPLKRVTFEIQLVTPHLLFLAEKDLKHAGSFEWKTKNFSTDTLEINRVSFPERFGNHVLAFALASEESPVHFMDNRCLPPPITRDMIIEKKNVLFYFLQELSHEQQLANSTTPNCEPPQFFENHELARIRSLQLLSSVFKRS